MTKVRSSGVPSPADFKVILARYRVPSLRRSIQQLLTTLLPLFLLWAAMYFCLAFSWILTLILAVPAAGFLVRVFIIHHDCSHGSYFKSRRANDAVGFALSVLTLTPYHMWRRSHHLHHATSGNLDRRGHGDVHTLTVREYRQLSALRRLAYRLYRSPIFLFGIAPIFHFLVLQRFSYYLPASWRKERYGGYATNVLLLALMAVVIWLIGFWPFVVVYFPVAALAASMGIWLFYVQHQFEDAYWEQDEEWQFGVAGISGSSHYDLPRVLQWFTANIGLHHLHHLDSQIPNYRLQECLDQNPELRASNRLTLWQSFTCVRYKLWDEARGRMVGFGAAYDGPLGAVPAE